MTGLWTSAEIAEATGGTAHGDFTATGVAFDSREVEEGDLFIAMKGETTDGHLFVADAFEAGAAGAIVSTPIEHSHVLVEDGAAALAALGEAARERTDARIVGVTGSVGKTGVKEALHLALDRSARGRAHRSVKSYNNHVGLPLSLARMPREAAYGVFEMGMNHAGELSRLTRIARPDVAIVTWVASAHREFFASEEAIADAKAEIFEGLTEGGTAILPEDNPHRDRLAAKAKRHAARVWTFGAGEGADIRLLDSAPAAGGGSMASAALPGAALSFTLAQPGAHWLSNALAVIGAVHALGADLAAAGLALAEMEGLKGRGRRFTVRADGGEALVIDESYNANPASMEATLASLGAARIEGRRIAVLGGMKELGEESAALHAGLARPIREAGVERAILVGEDMAPLAGELGGKVEYAHVADAAEALAALRELLGPGDAVLVKGSNAVGLSALVEALENGAG
ncbi:MAG: UDP-N-acetylmuramoyl-tripeptide--D-alanyl-D-alanine ligase [Sphingomonadaceae bacterium]